MKQTTTALARWAFLLCCLCQMGAHGQGAAFTYEGQLDIGGLPVTGAYDFQFSLYDAGTNGNLIAGPVALPAVAVSNGVYLVSLNFGAALNGSALWLESDERLTGSLGAYTPMFPRQELTPVPYAVFAQTASNLSGTIGSGGLAGVYTNGVTFFSASGNFNGSVSGTISGNGSGLTSLNAANLTGSLPAGALAGSYTNRVAISNALNTFAGKMIGDGSRLTNLSYGQLTGAIPKSIITNNQTTADLSGSFFGSLGGNGSAITSLNATNLSGNVQPKSLTGNYTNAVTFSNVLDRFVGKMIGDGSGLTNLPIGGVLPMAIVTNNQTGVTLSGSFSGSVSGNGNGLTSLNAANLTGSLPVGGLAGSYNSAVTFSNVSDVFAGKMIGDGSGLTNLSVGGVLPSGIVTNNETGVTLNGAFSGNGSLLTSLNATNLVGTIPSNSLAGTYTNTVILSNTSDVFAGRMIGDGSGLTNLPVGGVLPSGIVTNNETGVTLNGAFSGNGSLLTSLNATNLVGTIPSNSLAGTYTNTVILSNASDVFAGRMIGDGSGLTNLPVGGVLPSGIVTNNESGVTLNGAFSGNGSLLTSLNATNLVGTLPAAGLNGAYNNGLVLSNASDVFAGKIIGDGSGLTNLPVGGVLPSGIVTNNESGVTLNGAFSGNGSLLTSLNATNLVGTVPAAGLNGAYTNTVILSNASDVFAGRMIGDGSGLTNLPVGGVLPSGIVTNNESGVTLNGAFSGNGSLLTSLNATNLVGTMPSNSLAGTYTNTVILSNASDVFVGKMVGDGSGLTNLPISGGLPGTVITNNETGLTLSGTFNGVLNGDGSGISNVTASLPSGILTNNNVTPALFRGSVAFSNGLSANGNTVLLSSNTTEGGYTFISSNISALALTNMSNGLLTNAVAIGYNGLGPQIVIPGIQGDQRMVRLLGREGNALGLGGLVVETVQTNRQTYMDLWPSSTSPNAMNSFSEVAWLDVVDRDLSAPGSANWETLNIGMSGQGYAQPHGTLGTHYGGSGLSRDLWINGGNILFYNGSHPGSQLRMGELFATPSGTGFALYDSIASNAVAQQFAGTVIVNSGGSSPANILQLQFPTNSSIQYQYYFAANVLSNPPSTFYHMTYSGTVAFSQAATNSYSVDALVTNLMAANTSWSITPTTNVTGVVWTFAGDGTNTVRIKYNIFASGGGQAGSFTY